MSKVSIIIPVYNAEKFLRKCLDSVVNQTYKNIEIICVNDGSKDNSIEILEEFAKEDSRIIIIDKANEGVSVARNAGILKSTGEYITFVDSDDWLELDAIESAYNVIVEKKVDIVKFNCYINESYKDDSKNKGNLCGLENKVYLVSQKDFVEQINIKVLSGELHCSVCLLLIRRSILLKTSFFVEGIPYAEDCILFNELLDKIEKIYFFDRCLYHYYKNETSCTKSSKYYIRNIYSSAKAYEKLIGIIEGDKFEKKNRIKVTNDRFGRTIMGSIFLIYLEKKKNKEDFIKLVKDFMANESIVSIIENTEIENMSIHLALPFKLLKERRYEGLVQFYRFRSVCKILKEKILCRK